MIAAMNPELRARVVAEVLAFGVPHPEWGATPIAVVRLLTNMNTSSEELMAWCGQKLGRVKRPSKIVFSDIALPTNSAGKLLRWAAREKFLSEQ